MTASYFMKISIIVPIFNEEKHLSAFLLHLSEFKTQVHEIIFVDGGSEDNSAEIITRAGYKVTACKRGRARQMNSGADVAQGDVCVFLHADTYLPSNGISLIKAAMITKDWGRFNVCISGRSWLLPVIALMVNIRSRITGIATGDQAIFVKRHVFFSYGAYPIQPLMEDIELSTQLKKHSRPVCLRSCVETSGRRWESQGVCRTILLMWRLRWQYWRGVAIKDIAHQYQDIRSNKNR